MEKRSFLLAFLTGFFAFLDIFNHELMILNDLPALVLFALFALYKMSSFRKKIPFIVIKPLHLLYALFPLLSFAIFYFAWDSYYLSMTKTPWVFGPRILFEERNPFTDRAGVLGQQKLVYYFFQFNVSLDKIMFIMNFPEILLPALSLLIFLFAKIKFKKLLVLAVILPIVYVVGLNYFQKAIIVNNFSGLDILHKSLRYFLVLKEENFFRIGALLLFLSLQLLFLGRDFIKYSFIIMTYIFVLGYGIYHNLYDRHYIPVAVMIAVFIGLAIDKLLVNFSLKKRGMKSFFLLIFLVGVSVYTGQLLWQNLRQFVANTSDMISQVNYLKRAEKIIPKDGIVLVGNSNGENVVWISRYVRRTVIYNIYMGIPRMLPYGRLSDKKFYPYILDGTFRFEAVLQDDREFEKFKFYILDYNSTQWKKFLKEEPSNHPFLKYYIGKFELKRVNLKRGERGVYQLVRKIG